jgi:hypothetical protein
MYGPVGWVIRLSRFPLLQIRIYLFPLMVATVISNTALSSNVLESKVFLRPCSWCRESLVNCALACS